MPASENKAFEKLRLIADDFGATATKVNESSLRRKNHAGLALSDIGASRAAGIILLNKIRAIARENISLRDRHAVILNSFRIIEETSSGNPCSFHGWRLKKASAPAIRNPSPGTTGTWPKRSGREYPCSKK